MKTMMIIRDPEAFQLMADETRRKIIFLLRAKEMSAGKIAEELSITPQAVYHHIRKLTKAGMVEVAREERVGHIIESYYRATAEVFTFNMGSAPSGSTTLKEEMENTLSALKKLGFELNYSDEDTTRLAEIWRSYETCCGTKDLEEATGKLDDVDFLTKQRAREFAEILSMSDDEFARQQEIARSLRASLLDLKDRK